MKDTATYTKQTVVNIKTGEVSQMLTTVPVPSKWDANPHPVGWHMHELRANGLPDRRSRSRSVGVKRKVYDDGEVSVSGSFAVHRPEHEVDATILRENIKRRKAELEAAEDALINFYDVLDNGPRS